MRFTSKTYILLSTAGVFLTISGLAPSARFNPTAF